MTAFNPPATDELTVSLDARERRERKRNQDGFKANGLQEGEIRQGLDGRVWRIGGPSTLHGSEPLVDVTQVLWGRCGRTDYGPLTHKYARTIALWPTVEA